MWLKVLGLLNVWLRECTHFIGTSVHDACVMLWRLEFMVYFVQIKREGLVQHALVAST